MPDLMKTGMSNHRRSKKMSKFVKPGNYRPINKNIKYIELGDK